MKYPFLEKLSCATPNSRHHSTFSNLLFGGLKLSVRVTTFVTVASLPTREIWYNGQRSLSCTLRAMPSRCCITHTFVCFIGPLTSLAGQGLVPTWQGDLQIHYQVGRRLAITHLPADTLAGYIAHTDQMLTLTVQSVLLNALNGPLRCVQL